jgi:hypothetical protein
MGLYGILYGLMGLYGILYGLMGLMGVIVSDPIYGFEYKKEALDS